MAISYALYPNYLTTDPDDHMARVQNQASHGIEDIIDIMIGRGSTVTKAEALSVMEEYEAAVEQVLSNGGSVNTSLMRINASISGVFDDEFDTFERERHYVRLNVNPGSRISDIADSVEVEKVDADSPQPEPQAFEDVASDTRNETLTPGGVGQIMGTLLKVDPAESDQGVFFIASDGTETRSDTYIRNKPANLIVMIPDTLVSGEYHVEVRAKLQNTNDVRSGRLDAPLMVP